MNRSKSRSKRTKNPIVRSRRLRSDLDFNNDNAMLSISHPNGEESPLTEQKLASVDDDSEMLSDSTSDILSVDDVQNIRILNGFSLSQYKHLRKYKRPKGLPNEDTFVDGRSSASDKSSKSRRNTSTSSHSTDVMLDLPKSKEDVVPDVKLPNFEETIIEGFSIMAFQTSEEMELYARLTRKTPEKPSRRTSSRSGVGGRQRRSVRQSVGRSKKPSLLPTVTNTTATTTTTADSNSLTNCGDTVNGPLNDAKSINGRSSASSSSSVLQPLHVDTTATNRNSNNNASTTTTMSLDPFAVKLVDDGDNTDDAGPPQAKEDGVKKKAEEKEVTAAAPVVENGPQIPNGDLAVKSPLSGVFPSASKTFPRPASTSEAKSVESPSTTNKNRFSIAALTAVEDASTVTSKPSSPPPKAPSAQNGCGVGHAPTLWLERLSSGGAICDEEEVRQLAHLLFTDPVFAEQVSRLPCVALLFPQIMAFYQQHQDHQRLAALAAAQAAMLASTSQSFANTHASQHNSIGSATMSSYLLPADASSTKMLPPPPPPPPPLQLSHPTFMTPAPSLAAITPSSSSTTAPSGHPVAPPPPLTPSPALFHSSAMAAAIAAGMQAPANPAGFPSHPSAMHQQLMSAHFLSAPPPSVSGAAPQPPPPHPFLVAPPHQPTFWGQHPRLHPAPPGFPYLTPPPPSANLSAPTARKPPVVDAVDLTSPSSCLAASSSSSTTPQTGRSGKRHVATQPHALFGFPNFWAHQRSPVAVVPPVQQQHHQQAHIHRRAHSLVAPLPRFCDLFRIEGVPSCSGATAHLRICFHILMDKAHGLKPVNPSDPWWYASAGRNLPRPKPRDRPGLHPMPPHLSRFSNYEHILQTAFPIGVGGGGGGGTSAVQASPHHPIAIDLTRSPSPHVGLQLPQARKPLQHDFLRPTDGATKYFLHHHHHHHQQQQQHQQQEAEAILALKRRRVVTDASAASQLPASGHHQNGGIRLPMGLPFPQLPFRHPM